MNMLSHTNTPVDRTCTQISSVKYHNAMSSISVVQILDVMYMLSKICGTVATVIGSGQ